MSDNISGSDVEGQVTVDEALGLVRSLNLSLDYDTEQHKTAFAFVLSDANDNHYVPHQPAELPARPENLVNSQDIIGIDFAGDSPKHESPQGPTNFQGHVSPDELAANQVEPNPEELSNLEPLFSAEELACFFGPPSIFPQFATEKHPVPPQGHVPVPPQQAANLLQGHTYPQGPVNPHGAAIYASRPQAYPNPLQLYAPAQGFPPAPQAYDTPPQGPASSRGTYVSPKQRLKAHKTDTLWRPALGSLNVGELENLQQREGPMLLEFPKPKPKPISQALQTSGQVSKPKKKSLAQKYKEFWALQRYYEEQRRNEGGHA